MFSYYTRPDSSDPQAQITIPPSEFTMQQLTELNTQDMKPSSNAMRAEQMVVPWWQLVGQLPQSLDGNGQEVSAEAPPKPPPSQPAISRNKKPRRAINRHPCGACQFSKVKVYSVF